MILGFNAGGVSWIEKELSLDGVTDKAQMLELVQEAGYIDARCAAGVGGQYLRVFTNCQDIVNSPEFSSLPFQKAGNPPLLKFSLDEKLEHIDRLDRFLDQLLKPLPSTSSAAASRLNFSTMDAYFSGVAEFNRDQQTAYPIRILLSFVEFPPQWILDAPSSETCKRALRNYSFDSLWHKWVLLYIRIVRETVRHVTDLSKHWGQQLVGAIEIGNEPDYEWLPDEYRIEKSLEPAVNPLTKYVTELHLNQIPHVEWSKCIQVTPWGGFAEQDGEWSGEKIARCNLIEFSWGPKLDWYIKHFADLHTHLSFAVRDELQQAEYSARVLSCAVTHNNILYFAQMYRSNPKAFAYVDAIAVHPYHFPGHDIWNAQFRSSDRYPVWRETTPRTYARECFKRFDFIEEIARLTRAADPASSFGLSGKGIWITEFGIPTKLAGIFNRSHQEHTRFIRRRSDPPVENHRSVVWEDLWNSFFLQVTPNYLSELGVEGFVLYALRETTVPGFDKHDDDRSNFAIFTRDGQPRMDASTAKALRGFISCASGVQANPTTDSVAEIACTLGCGSDRLDANEIHRPITMLSRSEKRLLYFLTRDYYSGQGAIIDAGCFLGGSTVALAHGLLERSDHTDTHHLVHSFDRFVLDRFMIEHFLSTHGYRPGDSFRALYDDNLHSVKQFVKVTAGDFREVSWTSGPIEILFIDIAKSWDTNDHLVREFFPYLIPGRSLVIQQDYVYEWCPWLHITMERLADYFQPIGFVEASTIVYRLEQRIPGELLAVPVSAYSRDEKIRLMHRSVNRFHGLERGLVECAEAFLLCELGEAEWALRNLQILERRFAGNAALLQTIRALMDIARAPLANSCELI